MTDDGKALLLIIEKRDCLLSPVLIQHSDMTYAKLLGHVGKYSRFMIEQIRYRGFDFELVALEDVTPFFAIAKSVGGLWIVPDPHDHATEAAKARALREKYGTLQRHPSFDLPFLDRPRAPEATSGGAT